MARQVRAARHTAPYRVAAPSPKGAESSFFRCLLDVSARCCNRSKKRAPVSVWRLGDGHERLHLAVRPGAGLECDAAFAHRGRGTSALPPSASLTVPSPNLSQFRHAANSCAKSTLCPFNVSRAAANLVSVEVRRHFSGSPEICKVSACCRRELERSVRTCTLVRRSEPALRSHRLIERSVPSNASFFATFGVRTDPAPDEVRKPSHGRCQGDSLDEPLS